ncbi:MAG: N-acetylmuramoyl-L-alanine amidase [Clostridia bacterium]|nr:N-acetylmuramoyl-L-alanine amidase [Clostridia bacterium]
MLFFITTICITSSAYADDKITLMINGKRIESDVSPLIVNNRTLVPVRTLFTTFGADVVWNDLFRQVVVTTDNTVMIFTVDSKIAYVNGLSKTLDSPVTIINGRTFVPVRFVSEKLGYSVDWNATKRIVYISGKEVISDDVPPVGDSSVIPDDVQPDINDDNKTPQYQTDFKSVSVSNRSDSVVVKVLLSSEVKPKIMELKSPDRIVLDFYAVNQICDDGKKFYDNSKVSAIRWATHDEYTRLVVECSEKLRYKIDTSTSACTLTVFTPGGNSVTDNGDSSQLETPVIIGDAPLLVIDAGHGGNDCGAVGRDEEGNVVVYEADVNLDIALRVEQRLVSRGIEVIMTRTADTELGSSVMADLVNRAEIANDADADLFISIHNNAFTSPDATGTTVLYAGLSNSGGYEITSQELAQNIHKLLVKATGLKDRGLTVSPGIVVLKKTNMPAVLLECGFVTSYNDQLVLTNENKLNDIADAICEGIFISLRKMGKIK